MALKAHVCSKRSHGQDGLLAEMGRIEVEYRVPEGQEAFDPAPPVPVREMRRVV